MNPTEPKPQTPLTDAAQQEYDHNTCGVSRDFARSLELKLQETVLWIEKSNTAQYAQELEFKLQEAERQRDEAIQRNQSHVKVNLLLIAERDRLIKMVDELANNRIVENILADGRPHGSNRTYPDGCECDDCTTYDQLTKALAAYSLLPHVIAKKGNKQ